MRVTGMIDTPAGIADPAEQESSQSRMLPEVEAPTYAEAKAQLDASVPEGFQLLWVQVDRS